MIPFQGRDGLWYTTVQGLASDAASKISGALGGGPAALDVAGTHVEMLAALAIGMGLAGYGDISPLVTIVHDEILITLPDPEKKP